MISIAFIYLGLILVFTQLNACKPRYSGLYDSNAGDAEPEANILYVTQFVLPMYSTGALFASLNDKHPHLRRTIQIMQTANNPLVRSSAATTMIAIINGLQREINWKSFFPGYQSPDQLINDVTERFISPLEGYNLPIRAVRDIISKPARAPNLVNTR